MNHDIPLKYFDIADEYATECAEPVADAERTPLAHYFQLLLTRLMNNGRHLFNIRTRDFSITITHRTT